MIENTQKFINLGVKGAKNLYLQGGE